MRKEEWILPYMKQNARLFVLVIFLGAVTIFSAAFLMFTSGFLISKSATRPENILLVYVPIVAVRTFGIARSVSRYAERLTGHHIILKIVSDMRVRLYNMLEPASLMLSSRFRTGDMLGILAEDIEHLQDAFLKTIFRRFPLCCCMRPPLSDSAFFPGRLPLLRRFTCLYWLYCFRLCRFL